ncbi:MAG TPA: ECF transporter S component [Lachnospiraceae bacterium]|nr:ECF transporter S component [Lachnospiraceae bacterium]
MKKNPVILVVGIALLALSIFLCIRTYSTSYAQAKEYGEQINTLKTEIGDTEAAIVSLNEKDTTSDEDLNTKESLNNKLTVLSEKKSGLSNEKLYLEKPYSYSLTLLFLSIMISILGIVKLIRKQSESAKVDLTKLAQAGLLAALCYIGFAFFKIDIPVGTEKTAFHLGNVFCVLAALLLGGFWGGLSGAIGMTIADLTTAYVTSAPKTFLLKLCIGLIVGFVAHSIFKIEKSTDKKYITGITILATTCGMAFNVVADPLVGYFYKTYLLGIPQDLSLALAKLSAVTSLVNAIVAVVAASIFYLALRPALKKAGLLTTAPKR